MNSSVSLSHSSAASAFKGESLDNDHVSYSNSLAAYGTGIRWENPSDTGDLLVRLAQQALQTQQHGPDIVGRRPLRFKNVQTDPTGEVDVRVVDRGAEEHLGGLIRVVHGEVETELENQPRVGRILDAVDGGAPLGQVAIGGGEGGDAWGGRGHELHQLGLESVVRVCINTMLLYSVYNCICNRGHVCLPITPRVCCPVVFAYLLVTFWESAAFLAPPMAPPAA